MTNNATLLRSSLAFFKGKWVCVGGDAPVNITLRVLDVDFASGSATMHATATDGRKATANVWGDRLSLWGVLGMRLVKNRLDMIHWINGLAWQRLAQRDAASAEVGKRPRVLTSSVAPRVSRTGSEPNDHWVEVMRHAGSSEYPEGQGYGCWFVRVRGSGLWVNLGRTRSFRDRNHAYAFFCGSAHEQLPICGARQMGERRNARAYESAAAVYFASRVPICTQRGCACECRTAAHAAKIDAWWPMRAHLLGLDSFQIHAGNGWKNNEHLASEVVLSSRACLLQRIPLGPCPPVPLLVGSPFPTDRCESCNDSLCLGSTLPSHSTAHTAGASRANDSGLASKWEARPVECSRPSRYLLNCAASSAIPRRANLSTLRSAARTLDPPRRDGLHKFHSNVARAGETPESQKGTWLWRYAGALALLDRLQHEPRSNHTVNARAVRISIPRSIRASARFLERRERRTAAHHHLRNWA
jgi:hypothetical protein